MIKEKGWRGPITNLKQSSNWIEEAKKYSLEKSFEWTLSKVIEINNSQIIIETTEKQKGEIDISNLKWTKSK